MTDSQPVNDSVNSVRRERQLGVITPNLQRYEAPNAADWLDAIERQVCPICGAGPFTVVAQHVSMMHNIGRNELRDLLGIPRSESICDPTYASARSVITTKRMDVETLRQMNARLTTEDRAKAGRVLSDRLAKEHRERDEKIVALVAAGQTFKNIGKEVGLNSSAVAAIVKQNGIETDGRALYHNQRKGQSTPQFEAAREQYMKRAAERRATIVVRYQAGEGVRELAEAYGVGLGSMRAMLKEQGETVPDFRTGKGVTMTTITCNHCGVEVEKKLSQIKSNAKSNRGAGIYCSLSCAAKGRLARNGNPFAKPA